MKLIEVFCEIITQIVKGIFNLLLVIFGSNPESRTGKYSANFMSFWDRIYLVSSWNKGVCISGKKKLRTSKSLEHFLAIGGSGSGKTSVVVISSILRSNSSFICTDVDGDIFRKTSGYLAKKGYQIQCLNLQDISRSAFYSPLAYCHNDSDYKQLAELLISTAYPNPNSENSYWNYGAQTLIYIILRVLKSQPKEFQNLANLRFLLQRYNSLENFITENASADVWNDYLGFASAEPKIQSGMVSSALVALDKLSDNGISFITAKNTLDFSKLTTTKPYALFIRVPEAKLNFYSFLLSILYSQLLQYIQTHKPKQVIFAYLDEFSQLNIPDFALYATTMRRYNLSLVALVQSESQLISRYGNDGFNTLFNGSFANKVIFSGMSLNLARQLSQSFGRKGIASQPQDKSMISDRELMTVDELIQLNDKKVIFMYRNKPPLILSMKPYFKQLSLRWKSKIKPMELEQTVITPPSLLSLKITPPINEE